MDETSVPDSSLGKDSPYSRPLLQVAGKKFNKYVSTTSTHGVRHVFSGKSILRRVFWSILFIGSIVGCLHGILTSIITYTRAPTATTVYTDHVDTLTFPAVTICNLNGYNASYLEEQNLTELITTAIFKERPEDLEDKLPVECNNAGRNMENSLLVKTILEASQPLEDLVADCQFLGEPCDLDSMFSPYITPTGVCYTFNGRNPSQDYLVVKGGGVRQRLEVVLNIRQSEYTGSVHHEAGVLVSIHRQDVPALVWESGVAVPVGHSAHLSVTRRQIEDRTDRGMYKNHNCFNEAEAPAFEFLQPQHYNYSYRACRSECIIHDIAEKCGCLTTIVSETHQVNYRGCTVADLCCIFEIIRFSPECQCRVLCNHTAIDVTPSYSTFPGSSITMKKLNITSREEMSDNFLKVNVFYKALSVGREITERSYTLPSLIANIGGDMGIFMGASIISLTEFLVLIFDVIKDGLCGRKLRKMRASSAEEVDEDVYNAYVDNMDSVIASGMSSS